MLPLPVESHRKAGPARKRSGFIEVLHELKPRTRRFLCASTLLLLLVQLSACKFSDDAAAASEQMSATATDLQAYYTALAAEVEDTSQLFDLDTAISNIPYSAADRAQTEAVRAEILKRAAMADGLAKLADSFNSLVTSKSAGDVQTAATALGNELITVKALKRGSPVPDAVGKAGNLLLQLVQQHEEKKAARAMDATLAAITELFFKEKATYDSLERVHLGEASQVAQDLTNKNGVDPTPLLSPALKPFGLAPLPISPSLQSALKQLALSRLQGATDDAVKKEATASAAMLSALQEMSRRVHLLATEHSMSLRGNPFSLKTVESWVASIIS